MKWANIRIYVRPLKVSTELTELIEYVCEMPEGGRRQA
jgi:hypothetical protein